MEIQISLEQAKKLSDIGTLAATVAHELRNPLAAINLAASNIKRKAQNPSLDIHMMTIGKKVDEANQIINNLLFYTRIKEPHYEEIYLNDIIKESIELAQTRFPAKTIFIQNRTQILKNIKIEADPVQMKELFNNLINNSFDAIFHNEGKIEINAVAGDVFLEIHIKDNGNGIDKKYLNKIFDPFFTTKAKGTGLGLTVCLQIVNMHGGTIGIDSEKESGTVICVKLPYCRKTLRNKKTSKM